MDRAACALVARLAASASPKTVPTITLVALMDHAFPSLPSCTINGMFTAPLIECLQQPTNSIGINSTAISTPPLRPSVRSPSPTHRSFLAES